LRGTAISAAATFKQRNATVHFLRLIEHDVDLSVRGEVDFTHAAQIDVALMPNTPIHVVGPGPNDCVSGFELVNPGADFLPAVERVDLRGALFAGDWKIDLTQKASTDAEPSMRSFAVCRDGKTLSFAPAPAWFP
jgi:hypothetical protein